MISIPSDFSVLDRFKFQHKPVGVKYTITKIDGIERLKKDKNISLDKKENKEYTESYDKLVLSPGGNPIVPPIPGIDNANKYTIRNVVDIVKLDDALKKLASVDGV